MKFYFNNLLQLKFSKVFPVLFFKWFDNSFKNRSSMFTLIFVGNGMG